MASLFTDFRGTHTIQFMDRRRRRRTLRLGKIPLKDARSIHGYVEKLVAAQLSNSAPPADASIWLKGLPKKLRAKLVKVGLASAEGSATLKAFLDKYSLDRVDVKPATRTVWGLVKKNLLAHFKADKLVRDITPGDADAFKLYLVGQGLAPTTIHKRLQFCRTFFRSMLRQRLLDENPFQDVKATAVVDADRVHFVSREDIARVLDACPDAEWRAFVALARYGGLRCPSEHLLLKWEDVNLPEGRMAVHSPKTEHHAGKAYRVVPIFPELRPYLEEAYEAAPKGAVYVIHKHRKAPSEMHPWRLGNYRTRFERIIKRAGVPSWPKLFQNLRASRETELAHEYPLHIVTAWLGNTPKIALDHYLQVTPADYTRAAAGGEKALQKALHPATVLACHGQTNEEGADPEVVPSQPLAVVGRESSSPPMEDRGLEPLTFWLPARRSPN